MLLNCGVGKDSWESLLDCKEIKPVNPKGKQSWIFIGGTDPEADSSTLATWWEEPTHRKRPWWWERLKAGPEGDDRRWDGWMASLTQWTWVWASSWRWWRTKKPGLLQSMGSQRVGHDRVIEQQQAQIRASVWVWRILIFIYLFTIYLFIYFGFWYLKRGLFINHDWETLL